MAEPTQNQNKTEVSTSEIMDFLVKHMVIKEEFDEKMEKIDERFKKIDERFDSLKQEMNKQKLDILDAVDNKLAHLKGDLVILMRKEDKKVVALVEILKENKVIASENAKTVLAMEPFPQPAV
ncbi:MAG: hypothetical protein UU49_C0014G0017 [Candidatus Magasanikbacteria bacterium GW2011_GWC2_41_17]|uniref:Uncharacterized protein n=1 Tax=Candidatus Magasanikbacteria bacterium GW2011_GWC2_41_17 TaxID=1619048 RepID=A0A0G0VGV4_9BACT|nr:MAG: hypothetical protein UU49_C0014G0017 [Candidatus Magasanikbacteria bacterium GW2011_GWC2_41_17]